MAWGSRVCLLLGCVLIGCAGDNRIDPSELELRDVLGLAPEVAMSWDADQRASARHVLEAGMHDVRALPIEATLGREPTLDRSVVNALAIADEVRANHRLGALGVVELAIARDHLYATSRASTLAPHATAATELELSGWTHTGWAELPGRGLDVLTTLATDAGHRGGPLLVTPAPQLAVIAGYVPATRASPARLVVNPVLLAALEPGQPTGPQRPQIAAAVLPDDPIGNPYTFYTSVEACAAAQQQRCEACLPKGTCTSLSGTGDGNAECSALAAEPGRGYSLVCINFALAVDSVDSCAATSAPTCAIDTHAASTIASLDHNADFLDQPTCTSALDVCLGQIFGNAPTSTTTPPPSSDNSPSCADTACEAAPNCADSGCGGDSGDSSCDSSSGPGSSSGDSCSGDSCSSGDGGDCSSSDSSSCSSSDSSGCSSSDSSGCSGDSGGDCSGGGGNDCNASRHHGSGPGDQSILWACLPLPFAIFARRRAGRRRRTAKREVAP
ncbi:MAG: hypothetical protein ABJE66_00210 [Deltaproteobacteria bacterium]